MSCASFEARSAVISLSRGRGRGASRSAKTRTVSSRKRDNLSALRFLWPRQVLRPLLRRAEHRREALVSFFGLARIISMESLGASSGSSGPEAGECVAQPGGAARSRRVALRRCGRRVGTVSARPCRDAFRLVGAMVASVPHRGWRSGSPSHRKREACRSACLAISPILSSSRT